MAKSSKASKKKRSQSAPVKVKKGGASSMSTKPPGEQSRAIAYCEKLKHLAVANNDGYVTIRVVDMDDVFASKEGSLDKVKKTLFKTLKKLEWIEVMAYSPCTKYLAIGSHDNKIYLYGTKTYSKAHKLNGHSSFITGLDWSLDSKYLRSVCGAYELLFFNVEKKKHDPSGASNTVETIWADHTAKFGWNVQGIFPSGCDGSHINSVALSKDQSLIATGDDFGLLCMYRNPCLADHESVKYRGHSEHVTKVKFSECGKYVFSAGGQD